MNEALKDAGDKWLMIGSVSWNKHQQREHARAMANNPTAIIDAITDDELLTHPYPKPPNLYGIAGEVAALAMLESEADPVAVYTTFLVYMGALIGLKAYARVGETKHYPRLFVAIVGNSSRARKGTSLKPVERIIRKTEEVFLNRTKGSSYTPLNFADGGVSSAEGLIFAVRDESEKLDKNKIPEWDGVDDKRLIVIEEELANVLKMAQREGNTLSPILRRAWDGCNLAPMTKNNRLKSSNPHISLLSHITQFELKMSFSQSDCHNGLGNRFLWTCVRRPKKVPLPQQMNDDKVFDLAIRLSALMANYDDERELKLSADAIPAWKKIYHAVSVDDTGLKSTLTARSEAYIIRLSLLFALLDNASEIDTKHLNAALALVTFCNESVAYLFTSPSDDVSGDAEKLLDALDKSAMTQTKVSKLFGRNKNRLELKHLLDELQSMNKIKQTKKAGSRTTIWEKV